MLRHRIILSTANSVRVMVGFTCVATIAKQNGAFMVYPGDVGGGPAQFATMERALLAVLNDLYTDFGPGLTAAEVCRRFDPYSER